MEVPARFRAPAGLLVLRVFLGATFVYAGLDKLLDPGFFREGDIDYIGSQLERFAQDSPIAPLLDVTAEVPVLTGAAMAVSELAVGVATLLGVLPRLAALGGVALSLVLWLSATWSVQPYYLGSDLPYGVAWLALLLLLPRPATDPVAAAREAMAGRRTVLEVAGVAGLVGALGGLAALRGQRDTASTPTPAADAPIDDSLIAPLADLQSTGSATFADPLIGKSIAVALPDGSVTAFSSRCTHTGCTVDYDKAAALLVCPCHGSRFDPAQDGKVVNGPARGALPAVEVVVDTATGTVRRA